MKRKLNSDVLVKGRIVEIIENEKGLSYTVKFQISDFGFSRVTIHDQEINCEYGSEMKELMNGPS